MNRTKEKNYVAIAARYAGDVVSGKILACQWTIKACQRQIDDLEKAKSKSYSIRTNLSGVMATGAAGGSDKFLVLDVYRPLDRYVRTTLTRAVANSIYGGTIAIQYGAHKRPTVHDAATLAAAAVLGISPSEA